ncbi:hypothetical protein [Kitasatospora purpeofusca]|uniref:hypothetical protein n=1 Tax=Kitasatospora purpeofusca TaxID=67352 RepID=UPI002A599D98|nr:hypothetical protein [Kitasatospora purpeofusca]MDY0810692.1 hypothetical protein [Kitasatospora purpeofusca]
MSSSAGYGWSYVDQEAERRRQLRARLAAEAQRAENLRRAEARRAELRARLGELNEQAQGLRGEAGQLRRAYRTARVTVETVTVGAGAEEAELTRAVERARAANARAAQELAEAVRDVWSAVLPEAVAEPERPRPTRAETRRGAGEARAAAEAAAELARAEQADRVERVRAGALAEAQAVLDRDVPRCDPADLERVAGLVRALRAAATVPEVRATLTDLAALVQHSVGRRARDEERAELLASLAELVLEAEPAERDRLLADLAAAEDPAFLRPAVEAAVARADARRNRVPVAAVLAEVLCERGYLVGEDFEDLLAAEGEVVVPFGDPDPDRAGAAGGGRVESGRAEDGRAEDGRVGDGRVGEGEAEGGGEPPAAGYGLRLVLAPDRATLSTAVVRREDSGTGDAWQDEEQDESVQQWFCDEQLPGIEEAVRQRGVRLERTSAMAPGAMAAGLVPGGSWPQPPSAATPRRRRSKRSGDAGAAAVRKPQERGRER